jgi:hypothetical protein
MRSITAPSARMAPGSLGVALTYRAQSGLPTLGEPRLTVPGAH